MSRYIDADKLVEKYERAINDEWNKKTAPSSWSDAYDCVIADIDDCPTADVVAVRHGEWVEQIRDYGEHMETEGFKCSVCGYETMDNDKKYCPECGAKMDGKEKRK